MKLEWTVRYKKRPEDCQNPQEDPWRVWIPTARSWAEAGEAVKQIGEKHNPILITVICLDASA